MYVSARVTVCICIKYQFNLCSHLEKLKQYLKIKKQLQFEDISPFSSCSPLALPTSFNRSTKTWHFLSLLLLSLLPYFPNISRHFINFSFSSSRNRASTQARKYSEPKQSSQHKKSRNRTKRKSKETESFRFRPGEHVVEIAHCRRLRCH